tara:strand:- start:1180 stop:1440 length:261 start_codon:yes stop_codon:yes gene_type:complete
VLTTALKFETILINKAMNKNLKKALKELRKRKFEIIQIKNGIRVLNPDNKAEALTLHLDHGKDKGASYFSLRRWVRNNWGWDIDRF